MPNNITLQTLLTNESNLLGDATVGSPTEQVRKIYSLNLAKDFVLSQIGLPASETVMDFLYSEAQWVYPISQGYVDKIMLRYDETKGINGNNVRANRARKFEYVNPQEFYTLQEAQAYDVVFWSVDYVGGSPSILINTRNIVSASVIDYCNSTSGWTLLGDASNLRVDTIIYSAGDASLEFDVDAVTNGYFTLQKNFVNNPQDWTIYDESGIVTFDMYMQSTVGVTGISVNFGTDLSNYWSIATTKDKNGNLITADTAGWVSFSLPWTSTAIMTGSPDVTNINYAWVTLTYGNTLVPTTDWRFDNFVMYNPDAMVFTFYTDQVVTTAGGVAQKDFVNTSDVASFLNMDASIANTICAWGAMIYRPTALNQDPSFVQQMATDGLNALKQRYPKKVITYLMRLNYNLNKMRRHGRRS